MTRPLIFLMFIFVVCGFLFYPLTLPKPPDKQVVVKTSDDPDPKPPAWQAHEQWMKMERQSAQMKAASGR